MTTYRVGEAGATVFNAHGEVVGRLPPGHVVVAGVIETAGSEAEQHRREAARQKMLRRYSDKMVHVAEDKG
jgi:hypothetical protein